MKLSNRKVILILVLILALSLAVAGAVLYMLPVGTMVEVTIDGKVYGTYPLNAVKTVRIQPEDGSWYNVLQIADGKADMIEADCPDKLCVLFPPLTENDLGVIYCAPHRVVVLLTEP